MVNSGPARQEQSAEGEIIELEIRPKGGLTLGGFGTCKSTKNIPGGICVHLTVSAAPAAAAPTAALGLKLISCPPPTAALGLSDRCPHHFHVYW